MEQIQTELGIERYFSKPDNYPIQWNKSDVTITDEVGKPLFVQKDVEFPNYFSQLSRQIVASRYFYGENGTDEREGSFGDLVERVSNTYKNWALKDNYFNDEQAQIFKEEIENLTTTQKMSFNSPVWFNVGTHKYESAKAKGKKEFYVVNDKDRNIEVLDELGMYHDIELKKGSIVPVQKNETHLYPQTSACFIQGVEDTMEAIMKLAVNEAMLFKYGSGTGSDLSTLRSAKEKLSGGGKPSGPLAYLKFYDDVAGIVKSGGKTRRAAKMNSLRIDHPDIKEFIEIKTKEEKKIETLMDNGYDANFGKEAVESAHYQNANLSVRVTEEFMNAVENGGEIKTIPVKSKDIADDMPKYKAKDLMKLIAEGTHACGDPGLQFHDTINEWHTCKNSQEIKASNPCSEYMFVNDSSCNLASLNLRGFIDENGKFNTSDFEQAIRTTAIAMDLNYDHSSFPTKEIAENSHKFRPLGLGHANVGGLLMSQALAYDSDEGRAIAGAITALMTGKTYETSTEMAEKLGTFKEYEKNKEPMMKVMRMHRAALEKIDRTKLNGLENVLDEAYKSWDRVIERGEEYGFRNAQASVLAPTGTIGFMMDCDTKGVEPEIGLVQTKLLAEGGTLRMVNGTAAIALKKLGYSDEDIEKVSKYVAGNGITKEIPHLKKEHLNEVIENNKMMSGKELQKIGYSNEQIQDINFYVRGRETIEGCDVVKEEHLPVFDCSNKPSWAKRSISYQGHLKMMAAVQPFLSGAISKTVNLPKEASVEEIENVYKEAWNLGLKAVAIYRDSCKRRQPLSFTEDNLEEKVEQGPVRKKLPGTAQSIRHKFSVAGHEGYLHVGLYDDGKPGELFINMSKEGSTVGGLMDVVGTSVSMNLQYGVPLEGLVNKFKNQKFEPFGYIAEGHENLVGYDAKSLIDYIFSFMDETFIKSKPEKLSRQEDIEKSIVNVLDTGIDHERAKKSLVDLGTQIIDEKQDLDSIKFCPCGAKLKLVDAHCHEVCTENCGYENFNGCAG